MDEQHPVVVQEESDGSFHNQQQQALYQNHTQTRFQNKFSNSEQTVHNCYTSNDLGRHYVNTEGNTYGQQFKT